MVIWELPERVFKDLKSRLEALQDETGEEDLKQ
jgi:hypothetical protein